MTGRWIVVDSKGRILSDNKTQRESYIAKRKLVISMRESVEPIEKLEMEYYFDNAKLRTNNRLEAGAI